MDTSHSTSVLAGPLAENGAARQRAKERLYVVFQSAGWLGLLGLQSVFLRFLRDESSVKDQIALHCGIAQLIFLGWLVTHFGRHWLHRWGWKSLGWRPLAPRVLGFALLLALGWNLASFVVYYVVLQSPWEHRLPWQLVFATSWLNAALLMTAWLCIYFFYHLFDRFTRLEVEGLRLAANVKEAELRALKSQINPHFIFNSLNSLRALIEEDPARARQAVTQLANLLRYSLQSAQSETVAFENELRVVNDYLALEQVRHEERLRVRFDIDPATLGLAVPPLLLQTLVENAVKYGVSTRAEGGEIGIFARCEGGRLRLRVTNPGELGTGPAIGPNGARISRQASTGVGLKNAADRLRLFFGEGARLQLREEADSVVVAEVFIPVQTARA